MTEHLNRTTFPADLRKASAARRWLLERIGHDHPAAPDATLLVSEAFSNGVQHGSLPDGGSQVTVGFEVKPHLLEVEVVDEGGGGRPHVVDDLTAESGRGLVLMGGLAKEWGYERLDDGRGRFYFRVEF